MIFHFALAQKSAAVHSDAAFQASSPIQTFIGQSLGAGLFFVLCWGVQVIQLTSAISHLHNKYGFTVLQRRLLATRSALSEQEHRE